MSTPGLSAVAAYVFRSLQDHPELRFADAIAAGPVVGSVYDEEAVKGGLEELRSRGLAEDEPGRGWRLTEATGTGWSRHPAGTARRDLQLVGPRRRGPRGPIPHPARPSP